MRKPISTHAFNKGDSGLAFTLNEIANKRKKEGAKVINVTVGTLYDNNGNLASYSKIDALIYNNLGQKSNTYAPLDGGDLYKRNVKTWVFGEYCESLDKLYYSDACATPGGTGALYLSFRNYCDDNPVILPAIGWNNYKVMCEQLNKKYEFYSMFKDGRFDIDSVYELCKKSINEYGICTLVINDPCQNPTGYTLEDSEWNILINKLEELNNFGPVNLVLDVAYMDMAFEPRRFFKHLLDKKYTFNCLVCFSASKLFGVYGHRLGALICLNSVKDNVEEFASASRITARAVWSNCNHLMINAFNEFSGNKDMISELFLELENHKKVLKERYLKARNKFDSLLDCSPYPYKEGFFLTYPKENAVDFSEELIKKDIFVLPLENKYIRIGICSFVED